MWNYNLDEMPKDGTEIVIFFEDDTLINGYFIDKLKFEDGHWKNDDLYAGRYLKFAKCWACAPEKTTENGVQKLIDWFDYVLPNIAEDYNVSYLEGLKAIKEATDLKIKIHERKDCLMTDSEKADNCSVCAILSQGKGNALCLTCGRNYLG